MPLVSAYSSSSPSAPTTSSSMVPALPEQRACRPRNQLAYTAHPSGASPPARQTRRTPLNHDSWTLPSFATRRSLPSPILQETCQIVLLNMNNRRVLA
jgi:hypothetical protein